MAGAGPVCHNLLKFFNKENKNPHYDHPFFVVHVNLTKLTTQKSTQNKNNTQHKI
jgi:hypothetical protein